MQEIVQKINNDLKSSGWYEQLRIFLDSSDFSDIIKELKRKVDEDKQRFCPRIYSAFDFLKTIDYNKIKVVILTDYICNNIEQASGVPFSIKDAIYDRTPITLYHSTNPPDNRRTDHNSTEWVKEGVLIIPLSLTTRINGKPHQKLWAPFTMRIIETVNKKYTNVPWVLVGSDTWKYEDDIASPYVRKLELRGNNISDKQWSQWVNSILSDQGKSTINW